MATTYRIVATPSARVRRDPTPTSETLLRLPPGSIVVSDLVRQDRNSPLVVGPDDPATPEPAPQSRSWLHIVSYCIPGHPPKAIDGYVAWALCARVEEAL